ncbi:MAG: hypothetical protein Q8N81_03515 [bacterium]|nr:hypothetical protein [bacterium]
MNPEQEFGRTLSLPEQFDQKGTLRIDNQDLDVVDIKPEHTKIEVPTFYAPGWALGPKTHKKAIIALAEGFADEQGVKEGRRVLSIDAMHGIETAPHQDYSLAEMRKAAALLAMLDDKGIDKINAVVHSEGALYVALAAKVDSKKRIRNLVLVDPAGMIGNDSLGRLARDFSKDMVLQGIRAIKNRNFGKTSIPQSIIEASHTFLESPRKTTAEVIAIAKEQIHGILKELKAEGVGIAVVHGADDKAFPMERVQQTIAPVEDISKPSQSGRYKEMVDGFYSVEGTHNQIFIEPEKIMRVADHALDALERKSQVK